MSKAAIRSAENFRYFADQVTAARILMEIAEEAGLPPGVWTLVNGSGEDTGKALTEHKAIKAVAFVGESRTGSMITKQGADTLKRQHLELGGKNPVIVFDDADLVARVNNIKVAHPLDPATEIGPVLTSIPFTAEDEALAMANDTDYGLTRYLWTRDLTRALRITDRLEAGMI